MNPDRPIPNPGGKFESVQMLRGVAASLVVFHHMCRLIDQFRPGSVITHFRHIAEMGAGGVDIFFCISGFVITYAARNMPQGAAPAARFAFRRLWRVVPLYWIFTTLLVVLWLLGHAMRSQNVTPGFLACSYMLLRCPKADAFTGEIRYDPFLDPGWSLTFEMFFYAVCTVIVLKAGGRRIFPFAPLFVAFVAVTLTLASKAYPPILEIFSPFLLWEFVFGVIIAHVVGTRQTIPHWHHFAGIALLLFGTAWFLHSAYLSNPLGNRLTAWGFPGGAIVAGAALLRPEKPGPIGSFAIFLGTASYTIYLAHPFALLLVRRLFIKGYFLQVNPDLLLILVTSAAVVGCSLLYFLIERPLINLPIGNKPGKAVAAT